MIIINVNYILRIPSKVVSNKFKNGIVKFINFTSYAIIVNLKFKNNL